MQLASLKFHFHRRRRRKGRHRVADANQATSSRLIAALALLTVHLIALVAAQNSLSTRQDTEVKLSQYYVQLTRAGPIRGAKLTWLDRKTVTPPRPLQGLGFLGLAYAAPPVGPLRLMPPGAPTYTKYATASDSMSTAHLMPANRQAQLRNHAQFGRRCVRLADWRPRASKQPTSDHVTQVRGDFSSNQNTRQQSQSEDCLNLNVFIPIASNGTGQESKRKQQVGKFANESSEPIDLDERQMWPISRLMATRKLPVVVLFLGESLADSHETPTTTTANNRLANSLAHLELAHRLNAIVITFNHRIGLLGFLPSIDTSSGASSLAAGSLSSHNPQAARNNHALWDQIALLHWVRHNVAVFSGDPNNVTLMALDNQATRYVQLLALTGRARGLFNHVIITQEVDRSLRERQQVAVSLSQLLKFASEAKDTRRKLMANLSLIIQKQMTEWRNETSGEPRVELADEQKVAQFLQVANLSQLAQIEYELELLNSDPQLALINSPTLDDKLLFPHLSNLVRQQTFDLAAAFTNMTHKKATLNYCLYLNQLYDSKPDFLNLISSSPMATTKIFFESLHSRVKPDGSTKNLEAASQLFHSIVSISKLDEILNSPLRELEVPTPGLGYDDNEEDEDEDDKILKKQHHRTVLVQSGALNGGTKRLVSDQRDLNKRNAAGHFGERSGNDLDELLSIMSSFDLMIGVAKSRSNFESDFRGRLAQRRQNYSSLIEAAVNVTGGWGYSRENQFDLINFADLHSLASWTSDDDKSLAELCNLGINMTAEPPKSTLMFETISEKANFMDSVLQSDAQLTDEMSRFIRLPLTSGNSQKIDAILGWPQFETLNRKSLIYNNSNATWMPREMVEPQANVFLDLIPYLRTLNDESKLSAKSQAAHGNLLNCLGELDTTFSNMILSVDTHELMLDRIQRESKCLKSSLAKFRGQLRHLAWEDLEPLITRVQLLNKQQQQQRQSQFDLQDQPSSNEMSQSNAENESTSGNGSMVLVARDNSQRATAQRDGSRTGSVLSNLFGGASGDGTQGFRGFLAKAYRDAMGQALAIVVGTGLFIFILNLLIVVIIALRSRSRSNRNVRDSSVTGGRESQLIDGVAPSQLMQPTAIIKSTLKKPNGTRYSDSNIDLKSMPYNHPGSCQNINDLNGVDSTKESDLTPTISISKSVNFNLSGVPQKRLQFDLTGVPNRGEDNEDEIYHYEQSKQQQQQQVVLLDVGNFSANGNVNAGGATDINQLLFEASQPPMFATNGNDATTVIREHQYQNWTLSDQQIYNCSVDLSPPFNSMSPSTSSNVTATSSMVNHQHQHQNYNPHQNQGFLVTASNKQQQQQAQHRGPVNFIRNNTFHQHNHLTHQHSSPGGSTMTSTSHSMTPIQLEPLAITTSGPTSSDMSPPGLMMQHQDNYQLEPINLIFAPTLEELNSGSFVQFPSLDQQRDSESVLQNLRFDPEKQQVVMLTQEQAYNSIDRRQRQ